MILYKTSQFILMFKFRRVIDTGAGPVPAFIKYPERNDTDTIITFLPDWNYCSFKGFRNLNIISMQKHSQGDYCK